MRPYQDVHHGAYYCGAICAEASEHGANQADAPEQRAWCLICRAEIPPAPNPAVVVERHTYKVLDCSTAHLSPEEGRAMDVCPIQPCWATPYGWIVYAGERGDDPDAFDDEAGDWPGLLAARALAQQLGCRFVAFDADAAEVPGLPEWSW